MSKLDDLIRNGGEKRLMELFDVLDNNDTSNIDNVYSSVQLAMKIILSTFNKFHTTCVIINGVNYYNNNSYLNRNKNNIDMSPEMKLKVEKIMSQSRDIDNQNKFKNVNSNVCKLNKVLFS